MDAVQPAPVPTLREDLKVAAVIGIAAAIATAAVFPYLLQVMPELRSKIHLALPLVVALQTVQAAVLLGLLALIGLRLGHRVDVGAPWLRAWLAKQPTPKLPWVSSAVAGLAAALAIIGLSLFTDPYLPAPLQAHAAITPAASALNGFLASFYGGIAEEIQLRLFLMTLIVWLFARTHKTAPSNSVYWFAVLLAALLFGAGHLPAAAQVWPLNAIVVARTVLLNAVAGVVFGWLYWKRGLEMAMLAHFSADLVLHVAAPALS